MAAALELLLLLEEDSELVELLELEELLESEEPPESEVPLELEPEEAGEELEALRESVR